MANDPDPDLAYCLYKVIVPYVDCDLPNQTLVVGSVICTECPEDEDCLAPEVRNKANARIVGTACRVRIELDPNDRCDDCPHESQVYEIEEIKDDEEEDDE
jgi:hypothetical protein